jgi:hypothetical protein
MYCHQTLKKGKSIMDQSDIKYILELINDAITTKDWDGIEEAKETLKEFLDTDDTQLEE